jgi:voltage-gated potassium channel Kch
MPSLRGAGMRVVVGDAMRDDSLREAGVLRRAGADIV